MKINEATANLELPSNWANENSDFLDSYVDTATMIVEIAEFLDYKPQAVLLTLTNNALYR